MRDLQGIPKTEKELKAEKGKVDIFLDKLAENIKSLQELRAAINIPLRILSKRGVPPNPFIEFFSCQKSYLTPLVESL